MNRIRILNQFIANQIAAGEVVERPMSVVKELVENAIDAGATSITIETKGGGLEYIRVSDNGSGIPAEDAETAFLRHATSKIATASDLERIETLGFRGEALASIAAVSHVVLKTKTPEEESGVLVRISGGKVDLNVPTGTPVGTTIEVSDLFYNMPARLKFMKSPRTEYANIGDYVSRMIIARPDIAFKLIQNGKLNYQSIGNGALDAAVFAVYGAAVAEQLKALDYDDGYVLIDGFVGTEQLARLNRNDQSFFLNGRYIKSQRLSYALQRAYDTRLMAGRFPLGAVRITMSHGDVDVNVHPNKLEVRFKDENRVMRAVTIAVRKAFGDPVAIPIRSADLHSADTRPANLEGSASAGIRAATAGQPAVPSRPKYDPSALFTSPKSGGPVRLNESAMPASARAFPEADRQTPPHVVVRSAYSAASGALGGADAPEGKVQGDDPAPPPADVQTAFGVKPYRIIGQLFECYLAVQQGEDVFFIDQHAAHERRIYERLMGDDLGVDSQLLLVPEIVRLSPLEHGTLMENLPSFFELGFDIEDFGAFSVSVRAVPHVIGQPQTERFLHEAIALFDRRNRMTTNELKRAALIQTACKYAVKAGQVLDRIEIEALMEQYAKAGVPLTCPHGRPVMVRLSKLEFEKLFKRIV